MHMAYLRLCKLKQKWLLVTPFMLKKKVFKVCETEKWGEPMFLPPSTPWASEPFQGRSPEQRSWLHNQIKPMIQVNWGKKNIKSKDFYYKILAFSTKESK